MTTQNTSVRRQALDEAFEQAAVSGDKRRIDAALKDLEDFDRDVSIDDAAARARQKEHERQEAIARKQLRADARASAAAYRENLLNAAERMDTAIAALGAACGEFQSLAKEFGHLSEHVAHVHGFKGHADAYFVRTLSEIGNRLSFAGVDLPHTGKFREQPETCEQTARQVLDTFTNELARSELGREESN